ncbi:MAG: hypothetical protein ACI9UO_001779 [Nitrospinales bacterium]|jgi:hypothetical protein
MLKVFAVSKVLFRKMENHRYCLPLLDCHQKISESTIDKMEQSYFATGYM